MPFQFEQMAADGLRRVKTVDCTVQRARHMCRRFARRCGKRDVGKIFVFTANQRQQFGNRCRFARSRPAGNHHKRLQQCQGGGIALPFAARALKPFCEVLPRACRVGGGCAGCRQAFYLGSQIVFQLPHPAQKQPSAFQNQRRGGCSDHGCECRQRVSLATAQTDKRMTVLQCLKQAFGTVCKHFVARTRIVFQKTDCRPCRRLGKFICLPFHRIPCRNAV